MNWLRRGVVVFNLLLISDLQAKDWDLDKAISIASDKEQHVLLVFAGSDCPPCVVLE